MVKPALSALWRALPKRVRRAVVRMIEPSFTVATAAVVLDDEGRVLLLEHVFRPGSGWGVPGGFLAEREQPEAAVRRELREETGIELDELELRFVRALEFANQVEIIFRARARGEPRPRGAEVASFGWFRPDELPEGLTGDQRRLIARALDGG
jgi:ADP-ribose pyrophosphatase YjhB (NUDIX family)